MNKIKMTNNMIAELYLSQLFQVSCDSGSNVF